MKAYVLGSCHASTIVKCMSVMSPQHAFETLRPDADLGSLDPSDVVFMERHASVSAKHVDAIVFPHVVFSAFHPDAAYVFTEDRVPLMPPLGHVQSSLVFYAWQRDLSIAQTLRLFSEPVFEHLRYFDYWESSKRSLLEEGAACGFALEGMFALWSRSCFMHLPNHPKLSVMADVARELLRRAGIATVLDDPQDYFADPLHAGPMWPVYPEIAERLNLRGSYAFKMMQAALSEYPTILDLEAFVAASFEAYAPYAKDALTGDRQADPRYRDLEALVRPAARTVATGGPAAERSAARARRGASPYADLPATRFWRRAVASRPPNTVDPVGAAPFTIDRSTRVATAGSCFAANMARVLTRENYNFYVAEHPPAQMPAARAAASNYGVFSARYGNIYTARQLLQLFDRAHGTFVPEEPAWRTADDRFVDPFRARVEPSGFASIDDVLRDRERHLSAVRRMFAELDVFIFTLGITEAWRATLDGAVFSVAPGVVGGTPDRRRHEFCNFSAADVAADLAAFVHRLATVNPAARVVLTVSPQPPIATYEARHILLSATYSKAVLRVAAQETERAFPHVWYFPSFEIIAGSHARGEYYGADLRSVTAAGIDRVMQLFFHHAAPGEVSRRDIDTTLIEEHRKLADVLCDEEAIETSLS